MSTKRLETVPAARLATPRHPSLDAATARLDQSVVPGSGCMHTTPSVAMPGPPMTSPFSSYATTEKT